MILTVKAVRDIFMDCLFREEENHDNAVMIRGIVNTFGFHPKRLEKHKEEIIVLLNELPDNFHEGKGGGWSYTQAPFDRKGRQWGEQKNAEQLLSLGMGIKKVERILPMMNIGYFRVLK